MFRLHQGVIDWEVLSEQGIEFAFIKATEGATFADERFAYNYAEAARCGLRVGAYHFFRYDRTGAEQAENFISRVEKTENMLPPVIDVEFYGETEKNPPAQAQVRSELDRMVQLLREFYGMDPILYATERSYRLYIAGAYENCDIWIRNVVSKPRLNDGRTWTFWQFTNRRRLRGTRGGRPTSMKTCSAAAASNSCSMHGNNSACLHGFRELAEYCRLLQAFLLLCTRFTMEKIFCL